MGSEPLPQLDSQVYAKANLELCKVEPKQNPEIKTLLILRRLHLLAVNWVEKLEYSSNKSDYSQYLLVT